MSQNMQELCINRRCLDLIIEIIKKIPFVIPIFASINIVLVKILEYIRFTGAGSIVSKITKFIFNPKTPFYFNYWLIYIVLAIIVSIILALYKKYSVLQTFICVGINLLLFVIMFMFIITRM